MKIAIIGAGAAGCFVAANLSSSPQRENMLFEKTGKVMQKVKVSGGGRCNVTHQLFEVSDLIERYPRGMKLLRKSLHQFGTRHTIEWFRSRGVSLKVESDGRMFPETDNSQTIMDCIWASMMQNNVSVFFHKSVNTIERISERFKIVFSDGTDCLADKVVITIGGFQKEEHYKWITELGHTIERPVPSLFTFNSPKHPITELMGVSVPEVSLKIAGTKISEVGPLLITHWGVSGPVVLRASAWGARTLNSIDYQFVALVNWIYPLTEPELREQIAEIRRIKGGASVFAKNSFGLPKRLWEFLLKYSGVNENIRWGDLSAGLQNRLIQHLIRFELPVSGKTTFKEEFVTCGGVRLNEIDPNTMQSRKTPGLYFAGEVLDVDGITGGFNFQHAWTSAWLISQSLSQD